MRDVSFSLNSATFTAITGRSGSGKSTLLHLLAGLDAPDSGEISIGGERLVGKSQEALARFRLEHIGLVFQFFNLLPTLTLKENVALAAYLAGQSKQVASKRAEELLAEVELTTQINRQPHEDSGGEIQRTAIARALINNPSVLLADEPTGNLDRTTAEGVLEIFSRMVKERQVTLLMVSHDPIVEQRADTVLHLADGILSSASRGDVPEVA